MILIPEIKIFLEKIIDLKVNLRERENFLTRGEEIN